LHVNEGGQVVGRGRVALRGNAGMALSADGEFILDGQMTVGGSVRAERAGTVRFANGSAVSGGNMAANSIGLYVGPGGRMIGQGLAAEFAPADGGQMLAGVFVDSMGYFDLSGRPDRRASLKVQGTPNSVMVTNGDVQLAHADLDYGQGAGNLIYAGGGRLAMWSARVGSPGKGRAVNGVVDAGAQSVTGDSATIISAASCWSGALFQDIPQERGNSSAPALGRENRIANRSAWTCNRS
ncbi:MAG: hypothetical protein K2Q10_08645, partial [Rhodospirillales bacterium]|nr:hypothetical protein [Rhodospirillales bacterium]